MSDICVEGTVHSISMDTSLDRLVRTSDPGLQKLVEEKIGTLMRSAGRSFRYKVPRDEFKRQTHVYGEQFVSDAPADLDQYFDIINGRLFSRSIPTRLAVLYLFGSGNQFRPNTGALSAAGEAIAGLCMEQFGYRPLVRPLGVMPDIVLWTNRAGIIHLALAEAKASTRQDPQNLIEKNAAKFLVDVKTRAQGFSYRYEGYLIASQLRDGGTVRCSCLHVDLERYARPDITDRNNRTGFESAVPSYDQPEARLEAIIRLQAETVEARDEYLTSLLSEEATRAAMLELIFRQKSITEDAIDVYIARLASELGLSAQWAAAQELIRDTKGKEKANVSKALIRYKKPMLELE